MEKKTCKICMLEEGPEMEPRTCTICGEIVCENCAQFSILLEGVYCSTTCFDKARNSDAALEEIEKDARNVYLNR
jgi:hypothetical protein